MVSAYAHSRFAVSLRLLPVLQLAAPASWKAAPTLVLYPSTGTVPSVAGISSRTTPTAASPPTQALLLLVLLQHYCAAGLPCVLELKHTRQPAAAVPPVAFLFIRQLGPCAVRMARRHNGAQFACILAPNGPMRIRQPRGSHKPSTQQGQEQQEQQEQSSSASCSCCCCADKIRT